MLPSINHNPIPNESNRESGNPLEGSKYYSITRLPDGNYKKFYAANISTTVKLECLDK